MPGPAALAAMALALIAQPAQAQTPTAPSSPRASAALAHHAVQCFLIGGILAGGLAAFMFKRFYRIALPTYLGFFAGKRFVPIITALGAIALGVVLSGLWPPVQRGLDLFSHWAAVGSPRSAATVYGFV